MKAHITKRVVDATKAPTKGTTKVYDDALSGFGFVVYPSGKRAFFVEYGPSDGRRRMTLGPYGALTVDAARSLAQTKLSEIAAGADPLDERAAKAAIPTFGTWSSEYMDGVRRRKKQPRHDEFFLPPDAAARALKREANKGRGLVPNRETHPAEAVADRWRTLRITEITRRDVQAAMQEVATVGQTNANRWLASIRACFQEAVRSGILETNPAMGIRNYQENAPRDRVLSDAEFERVVAAFEGLPDPHVRAAFVLLLDCGVRKSEVLRARWDDFDLDGATWRLPSPKSGRPQVVPLAPGTVAYLRGVERVSEWFVPGRDPSKPRTDLKDPWELVREAAALENVTIHDLRRTFGLHVARRAGLHVASKLLRHSNIQVTERVYVPLGIEDLRTAVADTHRERGKVIEFEKAKRGA